MRFSWLPFEFPFCALIFGYGKSLDTEGRRLVRTRGVVDRNARFSSTLPTNQEIRLSNHCVRKIVLYKSTNVGKSRRVKAVTQVHKKVGDELPC
jgi:hypothetical protein